MSKKLERCPFCGNKAEVIEYGKNGSLYPPIQWRVCCTNEKCAGWTTRLFSNNNEGENEEAAITAWNRRVHHIGEVNRMMKGFEPPSSDVPAWVCPETVSEGYVYADNQFGAMKQLPCVDCEGFEDCEGPRKYHWTEPDHIGEGNEMVFPLTGEYTNPASQRMGNGYRSKNFYIAIPAETGGETK